MPLPDQFSTEEFIAFGIRSIDKLRKDPEVRLLDSNRFLRFGTILKEKDITKPWFDCFIEWQFAGAGL